MCHSRARPNAAAFRYGCGGALLILLCAASWARGDETNTPAPAATTAAETTSPSTLDSLPEPLRDLPPRETKAAGFQGLIPGTSAAGDIADKLGEPNQKSGDRDGISWIYQVGPFPRVEFYLRDDQLQWIKAQFAEPRPLDEISNELRLTKYAAVPIYDEHGHATAVIFPERGLRVDVHAQDEKRGAFILLGVPAADDFLLRAESDRSSQFQQQLADVQQALTLDPHHERAIAVQIRIWDAAGFPDVALERAMAAHQENPHSSAIGLELACLQIRHWNHDAARAHLQEILEQEGIDTLTACRARLLVTELETISLRRKAASDPRPIVDELVQIIQTAAPLLKNGKPPERKEARQIILQAHLEAARLISESQWRNRVETTAKWLGNAQAIAASHMQLDRASADVFALVWHTTLDCHANLNGQLDPKPVAERMIQQLQQRLDANRDVLFQRSIRTQYAAALLSAARALQYRQEAKLAESYMHRAAEIAGEVARRQPPHREAELLLGQALFSIGATYGISRRDHESAITWYEKAEPLLCAPIPAWCASQRIAIGDQLVSMGLSNWSVEEKQHGIELTEQGLELLQAAAKDGDTRPQSLSVALNNLAYMHAAVGNRDKAREFTELARKHDDE